MPDPDHPDATEPARLKAMLEAEAALRRDLEARLRERTRELLAAYDEITALEEEVAAYRKGLRTPEG